MSNTNLTSDQLNKCINKYTSDDVAIVLELELKYKDAITGKKYSILERNKVFRDKVQIL